MSSNILEQKFRSRTILKVGIWQKLKQNNKSIGILKISQLVSNNNEKKLQQQRVEVKIYERKRDKSKIAVPTAFAKSREIVRAFFMHQFKGRRHFYCFVVHLKLWVNLLDYVFYLVCYCLSLLLLMFPFRAGFIWFIRIVFFALSIWTNCIVIEY